MGGVEGNNRPGQKEATFKIGREQPRGVERGNLYEEIGMPSTQFTEAVNHMRAQITEKRRESKEKGERFNAAEYLRMGLVREAAGKHNRKETERLHYTLVAWDALAFHQYDNAVKQEAIENLIQETKGFGAINLHTIMDDDMEAKRILALLDVMATAIDIPHEELDGAIEGGEISQPRVVWHEALRRSAKARGVSEIELLLGNSSREDDGGGLGDFSF